MPMGRTALLLLALIFFAGAATNECSCEQRETKEKTVAAPVDSSAALVDSTSLFIEEWLDKMWEEEEEHKRI